MGHSHAVTLTDVGSGVVRNIPAQFSAGRLRLEGRA
jgi:hypothetical protein